jgi:hypothetical protein
MPVATEDVMQERRQVPRHRTLKAGSITFNRDGGVDCRVRNLSPAGACLEVASQLGIPDEFVLIVEIDHVKAQCHVIWRTATRLGVVFDAQEQSGMPTPARVRLGERDRTTAQPQIAAAPAVFRYNAARSAGDAREYTDKPLNWRLF